MSWAGVLGVYFGEAEPRVKWPVPRQIAIGCERHDVKSGRPRMVHGGADQAGADPALLMRYRYGYFRDEERRVQCVGGEEAHGLIVVGDGNPKRTVPAKRAQSSGRQRLRFRQPRKV